MKRPNPKVVVGLAALALYTLGVCVLAPPHFAQAQPGKAAQAIRQAFGATVRVKRSTLVNGQVLTFNESRRRWEAAAITSGASMAVDDLILDIANQDWRLRRTGVSAAAIDNNAGGDAVLTVQGELLANAFQSRLFDISLIAADNTDLNVRNKDDSSFKRIRASGFAVGVAISSILDGNGLGMGTQPILLGTSSVVSDWRLVRTGVSAAAIDNNAGGPASLAVTGFLNVGAATDAVDTGDLAAGTAASGGLFYDASTVVLTIGSTVTIGGNSIQVGVAGSGSITVPGAGATSEQFGAGTTATMANALAVGFSADATAANATAIGANAQATGSASTAIGSAASATTESVSVGTSASTTGTQSVAIGEFSTATQTGTVAVGHNAAASGTGTSTAIGSGSVSSGNNSVAIGGFAAASANSTVSIGNLSTATMENATAVGQSADATAARATAIGRNAQATATDTVSVGERADATFAGATAIGGNTKATAVDATAIGGSADATFDRSSSIGALSSATAIDTVAIGWSATASATNTTAVGSSAEANATGAVAIGQLAKGFVQDGIAIGRQAVVNTTASATSSIAIGLLATVNTSGEPGIAIGRTASVNFSDGIAIGRSATVTGVIAVALGHATSAGSGAVAMGDSAVASGGDAVAIGRNALASFGGSIALGPNAVTTALNQFVMGSTSQPIGSAFFGQGVTSTTPATATWSTTGGSGTDIAGAEFRLEAGASTGDATPSGIRMRTTDVGASSSTPQTFTDRMLINTAGIDVGPNPIRMGAAIGSPTVELVVSGTEFVEFTDASSGNVAVIASGTGGSFYLTVAAQEAPTSGTPQSVNSGTATQIWGNHFAFQAGSFDNSFTYTAAKTRRFVVTLNVTASTAVGNRTTEWFIAVNGTVLPESQMQRDHTTTDMGSIGTSVAVLLNQNDRVEVFVDTTASSPTVDIQFMNLTIHAIDGT